MVGCVLTAHFSVVVALYTFASKEKAIIIKRITNVHYFILYKHTSTATITTLAFIIWCDRFVANYFLHFDQFNTDST